MNNSIATVTSRPALSVGRMPPGPAATGLTAKEVLHILRRHMWMILLTTLCGFILGGGTWYCLRTFMPRYTAQTFIEVLPPIQEDPTVITNTQVHKDLQYGYRVTIANKIKQQTLFQELLLRDKVRQTEWFQRDMQGDTTRALKDLMKTFGAYAHRDGDFVTVSMTARTTQDAATLVNEMALLFVNLHGGQEKETIQEQLIRLRDQQKDIEAEVDASNRALDKVRIDAGITDISTDAGAYRNQHPIVTEYTDLVAQEKELELGVTQLEANLKNLNELATGPVNEQIENQIERDPLLISLATQIAMNQGALSGLLARFGEDHPEVRRLAEAQTALEERRLERRKEIADQVRRASYMDARQLLAEMKERLARLVELREEAEARKKELDMARVKYDRQRTVLDDNLELLRTIKEQVEKRKLMLDDPKTAKVLLKALAPEPLDMTATRHWLLWFPAGTFFGFVLSVALAFLVEVTNDLVRTPSDVARYLRCTLLGMIPDSDEDDLARDTDLFQVVRQAPYSFVSESYRQCRTNLELAGCKSLLVTSGDADDGKTSTAVNLALAMAAKDKKVLILDANFRQPYLQNIFPRTAQDAQANLYGLSSFLLGQCRYQQAIRPSGVEGLEIMDTGLLPPNPLELLASRRMAALINELKKFYDHIIIDSPPVLLVSDAKVLGRLADSTVIVLHAADTRRGAAMRTIAEMNKVGANVIGCVLFGVRAMKGGYFRQQLKSYQRYLNG